MTLPALSYCLLFGASSVGDRDFVWLACCGQEVRIGVKDGAIMLVFDNLARAGL